MATEGQNLYSEIDSDFFLLFSLVEILYLFLFLVYQRVFVFVTKFTLSPYLYFYSLDYYFHIDILKQRISFLFFGRKKNKELIQNRISRASFLKDVTSRRNSQKNIDIIKELKTYKFITASNFYEDIVYSSVLGNDLSKLISNAREEFNKHNIYEYKKEQGFEPSQNTVIKSNDDISDLEYYLKKHSVGKRSLILYEIEAENINSLIIKGDSNLIKLKRKFDYLKSVYPNNMPKLTKENLEDIIKSILKPQTINKNGWLAVVSRIEKSILVSEFNNNDNAKIRLEERKVGVLKIIESRF